MARLLASAVALLLGLSAALGGYSGSDPAKDCGRAEGGDLAIAACTEVIRRDPKNAGAYNNRAIFHKRKGKVEEAIVDYTKAIEIKPEGDYFYSRGELHLMQGHSDLALADYTQAIDLGAKSAGLYTNRGFIYSGREDYEQSIDDYTKAIAIDPKYVNAWNNRAVAYAALGKHENSVADYSKAIEINAQEAGYYVRRGKSYEALGKKDEAAADYRHALTIEADNAPAKEGLGRLAGGGGAATEPPKSEDSGQRAETLKKAHKACDEDSGDVAIEGCSTLIKLSPSASAYYNRGIEYEAKGATDLAMADYSKAIELNPKHAKAYTNRGAAYDRKNDKDRALADYTKAIESDPNLWLPYFNRGQIYEGLGKREEALADFRKVLAIEPDNEKAKLGISRLEATPVAIKEDCDKQSGDATIAGCTLLIAANPNNAAAYNNRAVEYKKKRDYARALADFDKAIELEPSVPGRYYNRANVYFDRGEAASDQEDIKRAIADFTRAIEIDPKYVKALNNRGFAYASLKQHDLAIKDYDEALAKNPEHLSAYNNRGLSCLALKRYDCALADFDKVIATDAKAAKAYYNRARVHEATGKTDAAVADYQKTLQSGPSDKLAKAAQDALKRLEASAKGEAAGSEAECAKMTANATRCHEFFLSAGNEAVKQAQQACYLAGCDTIAALDKCVLPSFCKEGDAKSAPSPDAGLSAEELCTQKTKLAEDCHKRSQQGADAEKTAAQSCRIAHCSAIRTLKAKCTLPAFCKN